MMVSRHVAVERVFVRSSGVSNRPVFHGRMPRRFGGLQPEQKPQDEILAAVGLGSVMGIWVGFVYVQ